MWESAGGRFWRRRMGRATPYRAEFDTVIRAIQRDLRALRQPLQALADRSAAAEHPMTSLRIHDILVWTGT
jgi:hypothetical protein